MVVHAPRGSKLKLPFMGHVDLCYEPGDRILGLGKLPRVVDAYARRFQIQEDLVREVAHEMMESGHARGVRSPGGSSPDWPSAAVL